MKYVRYLLPAVALLISACSTEGGFKLPGVYRIDVQQGTVINSEMLARLKPGMDKKQVQFIMGTAPLIDPFHTNRWEYVYTFSKGGRQRKQRHVTLHFENDKLAYVDGDVLPGLERTDALGSKTAKIVEVPLKQYQRRGLFGRLVNKLPFVGGEAPEDSINEPTEVEPDTRVGGGLEEP